MKNVRIILIVVGFIFITIPSIARAESYVVNLFNDNGNIRFDKFVEKVELDSDRTTVENLQNALQSSVTEYSLNLISSNSQVSPIELPVEIQEGAFSRLVPYYAHVIQIQLVRGEELIDTVDVSSFSQCNSNNVCEYENGETLSTCLADCSGASIQYSDQTTRTLQEQNGVIRDQEGTLLLGGSSQQSEGETSNDTEPSPAGPSWLVLAGGVSMIVLGIGVWIYAKIKK